LSARVSSLILAVIDSSLFCIWEIRIELSDRVSSLILAVINSSLHQIRIEFSAQISLGDSAGDGVIWLGDGNMA
jgi:hypothetical protein